MKVNYKKAPQRSIAKTMMLCHSIMRKRMLLRNTSQKSEENGDYIKLCGQRFWEFVSGDRELYIKIVEPLGHRAKEQNEAFQTEYSKVVNRFTGEFIKVFCQPDGTIIWDKLVRFNSGRETQ